MKHFDSAQEIKTSFIPMSKYNWSTSEKKYDVQYFHIFNFLTEATKSIQLNHQFN